MIDELPHAGKKRRDKGDEGTGHTIRVGVMGFHLGKKHTDDKTTRPTTADTLVAHEEREKPSPEEKAGIAAESRPELAIGYTAVCRYDSSISTSTRNTRTLSPTSERRVVSFSEDIPDTSQLEFGCRLSCPPLRRLRF
jgi:hypothetical protein